MADEGKQQDLELRIVELENQLKQLRAGRGTTDLTPEEIQAYIKVRNSLGIDPDLECGINECSRCIVLRCYAPCITRCIRVCDVECICGPCNIGGLGGGGGRFGPLGS